MPIMEILIGNEGETSIEIIGGSGEGCRAYTKDLESALGIITSSSKKPEYFCASNETCVDTGL
jgi:hypothetical protein